MFQIFMMLTNGAMCVMSTWSFTQSFYDNYNKKEKETSIPATCHVQRAQCPTWIRTTGNNPSTLK